MRKTIQSRLLCFLVVALSCLSAGLPLSAQTASADTIQAMKLVAPRSGWLLANNRLFWTDSLGAEWSEITPSQASATVVSGAFFSQTGEGWAVESSSDSSHLTIAHTPDKGLHWSFAAVTSPFTEAAVSNGISFPYFADSQNGWISLSIQSSSAFRRGLLLRTTDGGLHWTLAPTPPLGAELLFTDATHGWTGPGPNGDELFATTDAGQTWHAATLPQPQSAPAHTNSTITLPTFSDATHGSLLRTYLADNGPRVVRYDTVDAGETWQPASLPPSTTFATLATLTRGLPAISLSAQVGLTTTPATLTPLRSSFSTDNNGWILFSSGSCEPQAGTCTQSRSLMATQDGGHTFVSLGHIPGLDLESTRQTIVPKKNPATVAPRPQALASPDSSYPVTGVLGFDACTLPTVAQLQTWWTGSPYKTIGVYIGGNEFACSSGLSNLTSSYVSSVLTQGWEIVPIWVGPQAPGGTFTYSISSTPATAMAQGVTEADSAVAQMNSLGMKQGSTIVYDMEAYSYTVAANVAATQAFIQGWNSELHAKGFLASVYSGHFEFDTWTPTLVTPAIDTIWFTYFFSSGVACGATCDTVYPTTFDLPANYWLNHHRSRQTSSSFNSTYAGLTLNIDEDYTDAAFEVATNVVLTAAKTGAGSGTVATTSINNSLDTSVDTAISCGTGCTSATASFAPTDTVTLTATPATNSVFASWAGCTSVSGSTCTVATTAAVTVTATFNAAPTYALTVVKAGTGTGTVKSGDNFISCGTTCSASYVAGTSATLTATPATGSIFAGWSGCTSTSGTTCNVTTGSAATTVTVTFNPAPTFSAALSSSTLAIVGGQSATDTLTISPQTGYSGTFSTFACTGLPTSATCAFSPASLTALGDGARLTSTLTITTIPVFSIASVSHSAKAVLAGLCFPVLLLPLYFVRGGTRKFRRLTLLALLTGALGLSQLLTGCTPGNPAPYSTVPPGVPFSGTINVTVTTAAGVTSLPIALTITSK